MHHKCKASFLLNNLNTLEKKLKKLSSLFFAIHLAEDVSGKREQMVGIDQLRIEYLKSFGQNLNKNIILESIAMQLDGIYYNKLISHIKLNIDFLQESRDRL